MVDAHSLKLPTAIMEKTKTKSIKLTFLIEKILIKITSAMKINYIIQHIIFIVIPHECMYICFFLSSNFISSIFPALILLKIHFVFNYVQIQKSNIILQYFTKNVNVKERLNWSKK